MVGPVEKTVSEPTTIDLDFWHRRIKRAREHGNPDPVRAGCYDMSLEHTKIFRDRTRDLLLTHLKPGDKMLDVGCGFGSLVECLSPGAVYLGIDLVPEFIEEARKTYGSIPDVSFDVVDVSSPAALTRFPTGSFDIAVGRWVDATIGGSLPSGVWVAVITELLRIAGKLLLWSPGHLRPKIWEMVNGEPTVTQEYIDGEWPPVPEEGK